MTAIRPGPTEASFKLGLALLISQATAGRDDRFESAREALVSAIVANDPEWSPRAAYTLARFGRAQAPHPRADAVVATVREQH